MYFNNFESYVNGKCPLVMSLNSIIMAHVINRSSLLSITVSPGCLKNFPPEKSLMERRHFCSEGYTSACAGPPSFPRKGNFFF